LVEVVQNLIDNAVKYMGNQPQPHIQIGARAAALDLQTLFGVCDTGVGADATLCFTLADKLVNSHG
jgi:signal transduction histidine kinase